LVVKKGDIRMHSDRATVSEEEREGDLAAAVQCPWKKKPPGKKRRGKKEKKGKYQMIRERLFADSNWDQKGEKTLKKNQTETKSVACRLWNSMFGGIDTKKKKGKGYNKKEP